VSDRITYHSMDELVVTACASYRYLSYTLYNCSVAIWSLYLARLIRLNKESVPLCHKHHKPSLSNVLDACSIFELLRPFCPHQKMSHVLCTYPLIETYSNKSFHMSEQEHQNVQRDASGTVDKTAQHRVAADCSSLLRAWSFLLSFLYLSAKNTKQSMSMVRC
jgi:hypothetical protein